MPFFTDNIRAGASGGSADYFDYEIDQSVRMNGGPYFSKSPSGNSRKFTIAFWLKRSRLQTHTMLMSAAGGNHPGGADIHQFGLDSDNRLFAFAYENSNSQKYNVKTKRRLNDVSNWYHIVYNYDSTQSTSSNRIRFYINGELMTDLQESSYPGQNQTNYINNGYPAIIGHESRRYRYPLHGYFSEFIFLDGQYLDASNFGEYHTLTNQWVPKEYGGSYSGTSFYLNFANGGDLGNDVSGLNNDWSTSSLGSQDKVTDTCTNNFCIMAHTDKNSGITVREGGLDPYTNPGFDQIRGTMSMESGKWYWEAYADNLSDSFIGVIGVESKMHPNDRGGETPNDAVIRQNNGDVRRNGSTYSYGGGSYSNGNVLGFALDMDNKKFYFAVNGTYQNSGNPANGTGTVVSSFTTAVCPGVSLYDGRSCTYNFGQEGTFNGQVSAGNNSDENGIGNFKYAPPSGFLALCSKNLPDTDIKQGNKHFDILYFNGTGDTGRTLTGLNFQPDFFWGKSRSAGFQHIIYDSVRGTGTSKSLSSNQTTVEGHNSSHSNLTSFNSDGVTFGATSSTDILNYAGGQAVGWFWKGGGSAVTNNEGSRTSQVSANPSAGISIGTFTAQSSGSHTYGHGLGVAPKFIITKSRSLNGGEWYCYHHSIGQNGWIKLNTNAAATTGNSAAWGTSPTSTVFTYGAGLVNQGNIVFYAFSEVEGFSKMGLFEGDGNSSFPNSPFVHTRFTPKFVIIKSIDHGEHWNKPVFQNSQRYNGEVQFLSANLANSERNMDQNPAIDYYSNGFKIRTSDGNLNRNGSSFLYVAFAERPFKYSNAR